MNRTSAHPPSLPSKPASAPAKTALRRATFLRVFGAFLLALLAFAASVPAAPASAKAPAPAAAPASSAASARLDTAAVHQLYIDGEFDQAIGTLERALHSKQVLSHPESVFVFKHLGVMYCADDKTREKGKYYLYQLLTLEPGAKLLDMYASDMIYMIFNNLTEEFQATRGKRGNAPRTAAAGTNAAASPATEAAPAGTPAAREEEDGSSGNRKTLYWVAGGAAGVAAAVGLFFLLSGEEAGGEVQTVTVSD